MRRARRTRRSDRKLCALPIPARRPGRSSSKFRAVCRPPRSCTEPLELSALVRAPLKPACAGCTRLRASMKSFCVPPAWRWEKSCSNKPTPMPSRPMVPLSGALSRVAAAFEALQVPFLIGGSLASSAHPVLRATMDVDIPSPDPRRPGAGLLTELGPDWYGEAKMIRDHLRAGRAFNLIHQTSGQKFDIFPAVQPSHASELERAAKIVFEFSDQRSLCRLRRRKTLFSRNSKGMPHGVKYRNVNGPT